MERTSGEWNCWVYERLSVYMGQKTLCSWTDLVWERDFVQRSYVGMDGHWCYRSQPARLFQSRAVRFERAKIRWSVLVVLVAYLGLWNWMILKHRATLTQQTKEIGQEMNGRPPGFPKKAHRNTHGQRFFGNFQTQSLLVGMLMVLRLRCDKLLFVLGCYWERNVVGEIHQKATPCLPESNLIPRNCVRPKQVCTLCEGHWSVYNEDLSKREKTQ